MLGGVEKALERRQLEKGRPGDMGLVSSGTHIHTHTGKRCVPTEKAFSFFEEKEANILGKYKKKGRRRRRRRKGKKESRQNEREKREGVESSSISPTRL